MKNRLIFWTKTSSGSKMHESKIHLSTENDSPFCGLNTFYYEFQSFARINDDSVDCARHIGYKELVWDSMPNKFICKKCLKKAKEYQNSL